MREMVEIELDINQKYSETKVAIRAKEQSKQIENIVYAIENAAESYYPPIAAYKDNILQFVSQRDIVRVYVEGRKTLLQTDNELLLIKKTLANLEGDLNGDRFFRISQSEIINLYKVKCFDFNALGTVGVEFDCGTKSWASRSCARELKARLKNNLK